MTEQQAAKHIELLEKRVLALEIELDRLRRILSPSDPKESSRESAVQTFLQKWYANGNREDTVQGILPIAEAAGIDIKADSPKARGIRLGCFLAGIANIRFYFGAEWLQVVKGGTSGDGYRRWILRHSSDPVDLFKSDRSMPF
jgi:hypothetical protein